MRAFMNIEEMAVCAGQVCRSRSVSKEEAIFVSCGSSMQHHPPPYPHPWLPKLSLCTSAGWAFVGCIFTEQGSDLPTWPWPFSISGMPAGVCIACLAFIAVFNGTEWNSPLSFTNLGGGSPAPSLLSNSVPDLLCLWQEASLFFF